jgi:hypothetical protein
LPLLLLASGKTQCCEFSQFGDLEIHCRDHSQSGWTTEEIFIRDVEHLRRYFADDLPIWLVLDVSTVHCRSRVEIAELGASLEPLDRAVFGVMKGSCRRMFRRATSEDPSMSLNRRTAVQFLARVWEQVSPQFLREHGLSISRRRTKIALAKARTERSKVKRRKQFNSNM